MTGKRRQLWPKWTDSFRRALAALCASIRRLAGTCAAAFSVAAASGPGYAVTPNPQPFSPQVCQIREPYVYWAAFDEVFRFAFNPDIPVYGHREEVALGRTLFFGYDDIPAARVPSQPEGCRDNPLRGGYVPYMDEYARQAFKEVFGREMGSDTAGRAWTRGYRAIGKDQKGWSANTIAEGWFKRNNSCRQRSKGVDECAPADVNSGYAKSHILRISIARLSRTEALRQPVFVQLNPDILSPHHIFALSEFDVFGAVRLSDHFQIERREIDLLPAYYARLVRHLELAHVRHYAWTSRHDQQAPACDLRAGRYKFVSKDKLRRNELVVRTVDAESHMEFRGTWRATVDDDGSGVHAGRIGGTVPAGSCRFKIAGDDHSCAVSVTLHRDGRVVARQAGHCLGFGDQVDVSGTYVKVQRKGPP